VGYALHRSYPTSFREPISNNTNFRAREDGLIDKSAIS
jgi:hypothetical protein